MDKNIKNLIHIEILKYFNLNNITRISDSFLINFLEIKYKKLIIKNINLWTIKFFFISKYKEYLLSEIIYSVYLKIIESNELNIENVEQYLMGAVKYSSLSCIKKYVKRQNLFEESLIPIKNNGDIKDFSTTQEINHELSKLDFKSFLKSLNEAEKKFIKEDDEINLYSSFKRNLIIERIQFKYNNYFS
ncbi:hypothetical protein [Mycoplasma anserisalpingitidis]|uniref:Uncharacterized protein n=1 Tax=Mycoplasma anserisalpingitidis TaxID=519450 RepID=A0A5B8KBJ4_9MOLU|nr:hypothetical protein [Mycoplasma anserisalpingitidis]QDY88457.1 hypothetical protein FOY43_02150 [Mycoplasma anserisalpingitidis]